MLVLPKTDDITKQRVADLKKEFADESRMIRHLENIEKRPVTKDGNYREYDFTEVHGVVWGGINFDHRIEGLSYEQKFPKIVDFDHPNYMGSYGVADNIQQILERCPLLDSLPDRFFCISATEIHKAHQSNEGGWRWHKWGEYIGVQEPTQEYLYDEEDIDMVIVFQIYELDESKIDNLNLETVLWKDRMRAQERNQHYKLNALAQLNGEHNEDT